MPRKNINAQGRDFEAMSGAKIKALRESLAYEWALRRNQEAPRPASLERW